MSIIDEILTIEKIDSELFNDITRIFASDGVIMDIKKDPDFVLGINDKIQLILSSSLDVETVETGVYSGTESYKTLCKYDYTMYGMVHAIINNHIFISAGGLRAQLNLYDNIKQFIAKDSYYYILIKKIK